MKTTGNPLGPGTVRIMSLFASDPDFRRNPKTDFFCARCQKDIRRGAKHRFIHLINGGHDILHPDDEPMYSPDGGDCGAYPVGMDCARRIGMEWTRE